jgi:two-component system response regulator YesN
MISRLLRTMIVEDEMLARIGIKSAVDWQAIGINFVFEASNGLEAYEIYKKEKPEIIITDLKMRNSR